MLELYNHNNKYGELVELVLQAKKLPYTKHESQYPIPFDEEVNGEETIVLVDNHYPIFYAQTIIHYIDERYPKPYLFDADAEQNARLKMFMFKILTEAYPGKKQNIDNIESIAEIISSEPFLTGDTPKIVDLAMLPILPEGREWELYAQRIRNSLL